MKNPFERIFQKNKKPDEHNTPSESWGFPEVRQKMHREYGMVQLEFDMVNAAGVGSLEEITINTIERASHFGRAKIVVSFPISKEKFMELSKKRDKLGAKLDFKQMLIDKLKVKAGEEVFIERTPGSAHVLVRPDERHELEESISRVRENHIWAFVFDNSKEDMTDRTRELTMVYNHT